MLVLPSLSRVILSSRNLLLPVYLASTSRSLPRYPRSNRRGGANGPRPLAVIRRTTRCSGRSMSILSGTLTRYYYTRATENFAFLPFPFLCGVTKLHGRARGFEARPSNLRRAPSRNRARPREEICLVAVSSRASLPGHYFDRFTRDQLFLITPLPSPRRTVRFLVMPRDTREIISIYANTQSGITAKCIFSSKARFPHSHFSLPILLGIHKPALDQRHARLRARGRTRLFCNRVYDVKRRILTMGKQLYILEH